MTSTWIAMQHVDAGLRGVIAALVLRAGVPFQLHAEARACRFSLPIESPILILNVYPDRHPAWVDLTTQKMSIRLPEEEGGVVEIPIAAIHVLHLMEDVARIETGREIPKPAAPAPRKLILVKS